MPAIAEILSRDAVTPVDNAQGVEDDGKLTVADLVRMFEESEDATYEARKEAERDRDYVDNKQLTAAELATLAKRGQPAQIDNRIKTKIDYLVGLEKQQRIDAIARPRTPAHEQEAGSATEGLRYVADSEDYDNKRSGVWRNMLVEGAGGISVSVATEYNNELCVKLSRTPWDRMFWDPHSSESDFEDAGYLGLVVWSDIADAYRKYPGADAKEALDTTMQSAPSDTYDDKPKFNHWADKKRKRVRICQIWIKKPGENGQDEWHFAEFTKGGILKAGPSPHITDKGESDGELKFQSAYVDRDNSRYGLVREMITLQDGINKRKSKSLHLLNTHQTTYETGAIQDIEEYRRQKLRPDGTMEVAPGALSGQGPKVISETRVDLAQAHMLLLQDDKNSIDLKGPNATAMGDKAQGSSAASGRAIIASQQGGMVSLGDLLDNLRHLDRRVFRSIWYRIRQYWTGQKWIRVTDDETNVRWVGVNVDPMQVQAAMQQNPEMQGKIAGVIANIAELDCDIIIDEVPDVILAQEQFQQLLEMKQYDAENEIPFRELILASSIKDKQKFVQAMDKRAAERSQNPQIQQAQQVEMAGAVATVEETKSKAALNMAKAQEAMTPEQPDMVAPQQQEFEIPPELQVGKAVADLELVRANTDKVRTDTALAPRKAMHDAKMKQDALAQRSQLMKQRPQQGAAR